MKNKIHHKTLLFGGLGLVVAIILILQISSSLTGIFETQTRITQERANLETLVEKEKVLRETTPVALAAQARKLTGVVPDTINLSLILATLQKVATQTGITLGDFSIASDAQIVSLLPIADNEKLSVFQFKVSLLGGFTNIEAFIERLTFVAPILHVEKVEFLQDKSTLTMNFYFQPKKAADLRAPMRRLTNRHTSAIDEVSKLEPPVFEEGTTSTSSGSREDPFR